MNNKQPQSVSRLHTRIIRSNPQPVFLGEQARTCLGHWSNEVPSLPHRLSAQYRYRAYVWAKAPPSFALPYSFTWGTWGRSMQRASCRRDANYVLEINQKTRWTKDLYGIVISIVPFQFKLSEISLQASVKRRWSVYPAPSLPHATKHSAYWGFWARCMEAANHACRNGAIVAAWLGMQVQPLGPSDDRKAAAIYCDFRLPYLCVDGWPGWDCIKHLGHSRMMGTSIDTDWSLWYVSQREPVRKVPRVAVGVVSWASHGATKQSLTRSLYEDSTRQ